MQDSHPQEVRGQGKDQPPPFTSEHGLQMKNKQKKRISCDVVMDSIESASVISWDGGNYLHPL